MTRLISLLIQVHHLMASNINILGAHEMHVQVRMAGNQRDRETSMLTLIVMVDNR